jgi:hypothetical protein
LVSRVNQFTKSKRSKYGAKRVVVDGESFDSQIEASRWSFLRIMERQGEITHLERQVEYKLIVNGVDCGSYFADAKYFTRPTNTQRGEYVIEDTKGVKTDIYKLKKKLVEALYPGVKIKEVTNARADVRAAA